MGEEIRRSEGTLYFNEFNGRNRMRETRLEVIGKADSAPEGGERQLPGA